MDQLMIYSSLRMIEKHRKDMNFGLMAEAIECLGSDLSDELRPPKGMGWYD